MKDITNVWLKIAKEDYDTAFYLYDGARYPQALYFLCQSLEKLLKAILVESSEKTPQKTHRLENIAVEIDTNFDKSLLLDLEEFSKHYGRVRYPDFSQEMYSTKIKVSPMFDKGKELYECLKKKHQMQ